jgi:DNA polymerase (family X)
LTGDQLSASELLRPCDVRGLLHSHSGYADGAHSLRRMVEIACELGLEYLGISDHLRSDRHPDGLDFEGEAAQRAEIEELSREFPDFDLLHGLEVYAEPDGELNLPDGISDQLDFLLVSLPDPDNHTKDSYTEAALRVIRHPEVDIVSRPLGCYMLTRPPVPLDMMRVLKAAVETDTVIELDANPSCNDLDPTHCRLAADLGVWLSINSNARRAARLVDYRHGAQIARSMGLHCRQVINTLSADELRGRLLRRRKAG